MEFVDISGRSPYLGVGSDTRKRQFPTCGFASSVSGGNMVKRCARCKMRFHKCFCKSRAREVKKLSRERPPGQTTITWQCSPSEQLVHWRNRIR